MRFSDMAGLLTYRQSRSRRRLACKDARLQGCTPAWMQVVERRREQAAEVVERRLPEAGRERAAEASTCRHSATARSNCASSVEPLSAVTEDAPPWMTVVTSSK